MWKRLGLRDSLDESLRVPAPGEAKGALALLEDSVGVTVVDVMGGEHRDPGMTMLSVVPREERTAEGDRGADVVEGGSGFGFDREAQRGSETARVFEAQSLPKRFRIVM